MRRYEWNEGGRKGDDGSNQRSQEKDVGISSGIALVGYSLYFVEKFSMLQLQLVHTRCIDEHHPLTAIHLKQCIVMEMKINVRTYIEPTTVELLLFCHNRIQLQYNAC